MFQVESGLPVIPDQDFDQGSERWDKQKKLDAFKARYARDQMPAPFTDTTLGTKVLHALNEWRRQQKAGPDRTMPAEKTRTRDPAEIARYGRAADALYATLELAGFKTRLRVPIDLEELYVPLNAMLDLRSAGEAAFADAAEAEQRLREAQAAREIPLIEAFREARQRRRRGLLILGDPGSGKTTHLKRLLLWCLRKGGKELGLAADVIPVYLPLRELKDLSQGLEAFIEGQLDSPHLNMPRGFGARLLDRGRLLLLFDGLDEVSNIEQRAQVARWVEKAVMAWPSCTPVVTCRFAGYGEDARLNPQFLELHLRPLTREQSESFIRNWYRAVETGLAQEPSQGEVTARGRADDLIERLAEPGFRAARMVAMTRNPLLLANLCLVHRDKGTLPKGRARLYDECIDVLLERWRGAGKRLPVNVTAEAGRRILQPAALWLHGEDQRLRASVRELAPVLDAALIAVQWKGRDAGDFLRTVRDESGLLTGWGQDDYGLMHLGFQEYLAACEIRRRAFEGESAVVRELADRYGQSWWQEVILILLAVGNPSLFVPFMREVVKRPAFAESPGLLDLIMEATEVSEAPFVELLNQEPGDDHGLWARQMQALRMVERRSSAESLDRLSARLLRHPSPDIQSWLAGRKEVTTRGFKRTPKGEVELVSIPGGTFLMGSPETEKDRYDDEMPQHRVTVAPFHLGRYPVTNEEYARFLEANPGTPEPEFWSDRRFNRARQPVVGVPWEEARRYASWAGGRLPTEAEWEYAARAGSKTRWSFGEDEGALKEYAWYGSNSDGRSHETGQKQPNAWGVHDIHGNVWEWVQDCWHEDYKGAPLDGSAWGEAGGGDRTRRVIRGGSLYNRPRFLRSAVRDRNYTDYRFDDLGFRLAQDLQPFFLCSFTL